MPAVSTPAQAADGFSTAEIQQDDFDSATECQPVDGRRVWRASRTSTPRDWAGPDTDGLSEHNASAMPRTELSAGDLAIYQNACRW